MCVCGNEKLWMSDGMGEYYCGFISLILGSGIDKSKNEGRTNKDQ